MSSSDGSLRRALSLGERAERPEISAVPSGAGLGPVARRAWITAASDRFDGVRILVVDAHRLFAEAIGTALSTQGFDVCPPAATASEALMTARDRMPEVVMLGTTGGDADASELGRAILQELPDTRVVVLTTAGDPDAVRDALRAGFAGYVMKDAPLSQLLATIDAILSGQVVVPHRLARAAAGARSPEERRAQHLAAQLTGRELEVLALLASGVRGEDMADRLSISSNTVRTHIQNVLSKLGVHSRLEAAAFALQHRIVPGPAAPDGATSLGDGLA
jgi:two-component system nitrate/nitrite response regulator NarL